MSQQSLFARKVISEIDSTALFDGADLKRIARCDDGLDYAAKRIEDAPLMPISEWVGHHLWRACGLLTPDFGVLHYENGNPPAFGSRIELLASQVRKDPDSYTIAGFFREHRAALSLSYPLDAFFINPDRHGRNFLVRPTLTKPELLCFDFSRAWAAHSLPCGNESAMAGCLTSQWWSFFVGTMRLRPDHSALQAAQALDDSWLSSILNLAPAAWLAQFDTAAALSFWHDSREARAAFAAQWAEAS